MIQNKKKEKAGSNGVRIFLMLKVYHLELHNGDMKLKLPNCFISDY